MERGRINGLSPINFEPHCCLLLRHAGPDNLHDRDRSCRAGTVVASSFGRPTRSASKAKARAETGSRTCFEASAKTRFQAESTFEFEAREVASSTDADSCEAATQTRPETQTGNNDIKPRSLQTQLGAIRGQSKPDSEPCFQTSRTSAPKTSRNGHREANSQPHPASTNRASHAATTNGTCEGSPSR
jgi:hypothetical protein